MPFPDQGPERIARRGILSCPENTTPSCTPVFSAARQYQQLMRAAIISKPKQLYTLAMKRLLAVFAFSALAALAADITGTWKATADFGNGPMERTFTFKQDGNKVTGETTSSMMGKSAITDGKVEGDTVTFTITGSSAIK